MPRKDTFITKATKTFGNKFDYSKVVCTLASEKVVIICLSHGEFTIDQHSFLNSRMGCPRCSRENMSNKQTSKQFIAKALNKFGASFDYSKVHYYGSKKHVTITCPEHGEFSQAPEKHLSSKHGCPKCAAVATGKAHTITTGEFIAKAKELHGNKFDYSKTMYTSYMDKVTITCNSCGATIEQTPNSHMNGNGCSNCSTNGFNINKPAMLYYLSLNDGEAYKIGITNRTVEARFNLTDLASIVVVKTWHFTLGKDALNKERTILKEYEKYKYIGPDLLSSGNTELFNKDILCLDKKETDEISNT